MAHYSVGQMSGIFIIKIVSKRGISELADSLRNKRSICLRQQSNNV